VRHLLLQHRARVVADSIDHPPGAHDDLANAVAGVCHLAIGRHAGKAVGFNFPCSRSEALALDAAARGELPPVSRYFPEAWEPFRPWGRSVAEPGDRLRQTPVSDGSPSEGSFR
jgi:hypothetical protein